MADSLGSLFVDFLKTLLKFIITKIYFFFKKNKNIEDDNGLNEIYYDDGKGPIKSRFNMRNPIGKKGWKHGLYESWYRNGQLQSVKEYNMGDEIWSKSEFWDEYGNDITERVKKEKEEIRKRRSSFHWTDRLKATAKAERRFRMTDSEKKLDSLLETSSFFKSDIFYIEGFRIPDNFYEIKKRLKSNVVPPLISSGLNDDDIKKLLILIFKENPSKQFKYDNLERLYRKLQPDRDSNFNIIVREILDSGILKSIKGGKFQINISADDANKSLKSIKGGELKSLVEEHKNLTGDQKMLLVMFKELKGIDYAGVRFDAQGNTPEEFLASDIDGSWYYSQSQIVMIFKAFSNETFNENLQNLLNVNKIKLEDETSMPGGIRVWNGEGFQIEHPPQLNGANMIMITNTELKVKHE